MLKFLFSFILLNQLLFNIITKITEEDYNKAAEDYKNNYIKEFREKVKDYLTKRNLYKNEKKLICKEEFILIFRDIMSDGNEQNVSEGFGETFNNLIDIFVDDAFPEGVKYMKGSDIHKYFEYDNIMDKFNKYMTKIYQQYDPNKRPKTSNDNDL